MNFLVYVDAEAGELEKILSGVKSMLVKEADADQPEEQDMQPGDSLYFLRDNGENEVRVEARVVQAKHFEEGPEEDLAHMLKEMQPRLQLTEEQYNQWAGKQQALFIELEAAHKIEGWRVTLEEAAQRTGWGRLEESPAPEQEGRE